MISRLEQSPRDPITPELFSRWRRDPVTERLYHDLTLAYLHQMVEPLPESIDLAIPIVFERKGAKEMLDVFADWMPDEVRDDGGEE